MANVSEEADIGTTVLIVTAMDRDTVSSTSQYKLLRVTSLT